MVCTAVSFVVDRGLFFERTKIVACGESNWPIACRVYVCVIVSYLMHLYPACLLEENCKTMDLFIKINSVCCAFSFSFHVKVKLWSLCSKHLHLQVSLQEP